MTRIAFLDTETTSLDWDLGEIFEVAVILRENGEDTEHTWMLPVERLAYADQFALKLTGFHDRHPQGLGNIDPKDGKIGQIAKVTDLETFARQFVALTRDSHIVGMVPSFDEERLRKLVRSVGLVHAWHYHLIDAEVLALGKLFADPVTKVIFQEPPWASEDVSAQLGVDPEKYERHTALGDARWCRDLYDAVMGT